MRVSGLEGMMSEHRKGNKCREEGFVTKSDILLRLLPESPKPSTISVTEPGCCLEFHPLTVHYSRADLLSHHQNLQLLCSCGLVNKKASTQMLAVVEVTASSFECDLRGPTCCIRELECVKAQGIKLSA